MPTAAKHLLIVLLLATASAAESPSPTAPQKIPSQDLLADAAILRRAYEQLHPGLYRYNTREEMNGHFDELARQLGHDQSLAEAYLAFSLFTAKLKCGHSYPNFFNQPKAVKAALFQGQNRVPFYFRWIDRRMIVLRDFSGDRRIRPGTEILAINGVPAGEILDKLMTITRADGSNDAKRVDLLNLTGDSEYETFDVYFPLFFPQTSPQASPTMKLLARSPGDRKAEAIEVRALTYEQRLAPIREKVEGRKQDFALWTFRFLRPDVAYLQMHDWALYDSKWDWQAFLDDVFRQLEARKPANLVIDLRGNEGGIDAGNPVLRHLIDHDLRLEEYERRVRYRKVPDDLVPYLDTWDFSFKDWGEKAIDPHDGFFRLTRYDDDQRGEVLTPAGKKFSGKVWVLVDASNSSATFQFARVVQANRLGTLAGQPTGGNLRGINGGAFFFLRLPNSHIEVDLPLIGTFPASAQRDAGLQPDLRIALDPEDIAAGRDTVLEEILRQSKP